LPRRRAGLAATFREGPRISRQPERKVMVNTSKEQEYCKQAERLRKVDKVKQKLAIALYRKAANNIQLGKEDRQDAAEKADALERLLKLKCPQS
jgi:hypothetical protein